jgi:hypothetical protein
VIFLVVDRIQVVVVMATMSRWMIPMRLALCLLPMFFLRQILSLHEVEN